MANPEPTKPTPPYMAASLFKGTVDDFAAVTVPNALDRGVLSKLSGADYSALISGLRFLGLVDQATNDVKAEYKTLVNARKQNEQTYKATLLPIMEKAYKPIVQSVDLQHGTLSQLEKAFRDYGVPSGQMLNKSIRFYIKTLQYCGETVSQYITKSRPRQTNGSKKADAPRAIRKKATPAEVRDDGWRADSQPKGFERMPIPGVEGAFIQYPTDLTDADCALFEAIIGVLRTYVKGRSGRKEKV